MLSTQTSDLWGLFLVCGNHTVTPTSNRKQYRCLNLFCHTNCLNLKSLCVHVGQQYSLSHEDIFRAFNVAREAVSLTLGCVLFEQCSGLIRQRIAWQLALQDGQLHPALRFCDLWFSLNSQRVWVALPSHHNQPGWGGSMAFQQASSKSPADQTMDWEIMKKKASHNQKVDPFTDNDFRKSLQIPIY